MAKKHANHPGQTTLFPKGSDLQSFVEHSTEFLPAVSDESSDPFSVFVGMSEQLDEIEQEAQKSGKTLPGGWRIPAFQFSREAKVDKATGKKKWRLIGAPNIAMSVLHRRFERLIRETCMQMPSEWVRLVRFPSARAFVPGSDTLENVRAHRGRQYFYITDLERAYDSLDIDMLIVLLTTVLNFPEHEDSLAEIAQSVKFGACPGRETTDRILVDPLSIRVRKFVSMFCLSPTGRGIVTGAPSSPYLFNLYCELMLDQGLRFLMGGEDNRIKFTRYADDLVFSGTKPLWFELRREVRKHIVAAGFRVNHRKSKVLYTKQGIVTVTGFGLDAEGRTVFPGRKRLALQGMLRTYLEYGKGDPHKIGGHVAYFRHYARNVRPTESDKRLLKLCEEFESAKAMTRF